MGSSASEGVYPLHCSKTIHLVRHAQGVHNVEGQKDPNAYMSEELFDAPLTHLGWQQVDNLRKHVHASGLSKHIELVVVSPMMRMMQTAVGAFGGESSADGIDVPPLMVENTGDSDRPAISSLNCPAFIAVDLCREHVELYPCDRRRSISEYKPIFPAINFSFIENDGDVLWKSDTKEKIEEVAARGGKVYEMLILCRLLIREEKEIAVLWFFFYHMLGAYGDDIHPTLKNKMSIPLKNCELRSMVIVNRSMIGSNTSKTDFPGKIPSGTDVPRNAA